MLQTFSNVQERLEMPKKYKKARRNNRDTTARDCQISEWYPRIHLIFPCLSTPSVPAMPDICQHLKRALQSIANMYYIPTSV